MTDTGLHPHRSELTLEIPILSLLASFLLPRKRWILFTLMGFIHSSSCWRMRGGSEWGCTPVNCMCSAETSSIPSAQATGTATTSSHTGTHEGLWTHSVFPFPTHAVQLHPVKLQARPNTGGFPSLQSDPYTLLHCLAQNHVWFVAVSLQRLQRDGINVPKNGISHFNLSYKEVYN